MSTARPDPGVIALAIFFALAPAFAVGGALGMAVLVFVAGIACLRPSLLHGAIEKKPIFPVLLALFLGWMGASCWWTPEAGAGERLAKLAAVAATGMAFAAVASGAGRRLTLAGGVATAIVLCGLLTIEAATSFIFNRAARPDIDSLELTRNASRAGAFLAVVVWGAAGALVILPVRWGWPAAAVLLAGAGILSAQFGSSANVLAFGAGLVAFIAGYVAPRLALWLSCAGVAAWTALAPVLTPLAFANDALARAIPYSWAVRGGMWDYTIARIWEQPWIGHGLEASRAVDETIIVRGEQMDAIANHPHSLSLQIWFELGAIGVAIAVLMALAGGRWLARAYGEQRAAAAAACGTIAAAGVIANVSFSAWAEWWLATLFVAAGVVGAIGARKAPATRAFG